MRIQSKFDKLETQSKKEYTSENLKMRFHSQTTKRRRHKRIDSSENTEIIQAHAYKRIDGVMVF